VQAGAEHPLLAPLVQRLEEQQRLLRAAVDHDDRTRLDDTCQVEKLIVLAKRLLARPFGRPLQDRNGVVASFEFSSKAEAEEKLREHFTRGSALSSRDRFSQQDRSSSTSQMLIVASALGTTFTMGLRKLIRKHKLTATSVCDLDY
jgi:hypothetical protein